MPSDKHNLRTARARDLISSLINVTSSRGVPFHQPQLLQCLHQGATFDLPFFSSQPRKVTICGGHKMASVRDIKIDEALLVLCLAYYVMQRVCHCRNWDSMAFTYQDMWRAFHEYILRIFRNGWMDCRDAFHLPILLCNGQNIAEYEAYWLMGFPIINLWSMHFRSVFSVFSAMAGWITDILFMLFFACVTNATKLSTKQTGLSVFW